MKEVELEDDKIIGNVQEDFKSVLLAIFKVLILNTYSKKKIK